MLKTLSRTLIDVHQVTNPDDERRRRLLNILLVGLMVVAGVVIVLTLIASLTGNAGSPDEVSLQNVIDVLQGKAEPETDGREGLRSLEVLIAAYLSARDGKTISLPLEY